MSTKRTFTVAVIGLTTQEQNVLINCFRLSTHRPFAYSQIPLSAERAADIVIVDGDNEEAMTEWEAIRHHRDSNNQLATCIVSQLTIRDDDCDPPYPKAAIAISRAEDFRSSSE